LYLPGLWFHHISVRADSPSVAVNVFWKSLPASEYDPTDVYGRYVHSIFPQSDDDDDDDDNKSAL
jgi:hypothetical protein